MELKKQTKFIKGKREIGKILICLIIAIIMLTSLKAIATTIIAGSAEVIEDEKTIVRTAASVSRGASSSNKVEVATLTAELGRYASTTVTQISSEILQVKFNRTGNLYEINVNVGPTFDVTGAIPYLPVGYTPVKNTDLETGFVIEDENGNQFVWVEVPRTAEVYPTAGTNITSFNDATYNNIEADLHTYTSVYRNGTIHTDTWSSEAATGLTSDEYYIQKKKMLKSIYKNGGFYIGRYETGIENSYRTAAGETTQTPVIKQNAYPYGWVNASQAQTLASSFAQSQAGYTSSLMFGVQWDLVLKYLETKGATPAELNTNSTGWGNYLNNAYTIDNSNVKYSADFGVTWSTASSYDKPAPARILLTMGASDIFCKQNIYDLAGNQWEWTLEHTNDSENLISYRAGGYRQYGNEAPVSNRYIGDETHTSASVGFRTALYKDETDTTQKPTYIPEGYTHIAGNMDEGYVIADASGNEYVWVEVPRTAEVYPTAGTNINTFTSTAYDKIEADLNIYTSAYRSGTARQDKYCSNEATGLTETEYNTLKKKMLKSVYKNGGFYVGRYETGIDYGEGPRTASGDTTQTPVIKQNAYPYIYVSVPQSQTLAENFATSGYTTSLMFDMQWNLTMKYLENKGMTQEELVEDSVSWGNYINNLYNITNADAKYSTDYGSTWSSAPYSKESAASILLTTGASDTFCKQNIYDLAGNEYEWTLGVLLTEQKNIQRGNYYATSSVKFAAAVYGSANFGTSAHSKGFRVALYRDETDTTRTPTYIPEGYTHIAGNMDEGYVIADASGNEFVWVEVPRTAAVYPTAGTNITAFTSTAYDKIEADLHAYTSVYRNGTTYTDTWSSESATGLTSNQYYTQKKKMLKSIYKNGGFYVGRYETGTMTARTASGQSLTTAVIKKNEYPYNYITNSQAQSLASGMTSGEYTSSLMFGVQWDLTLKYLETKNVTQAELITDSTSWGNYNNNLWNVVNTNAKFYVDGAENWTSGTYKKTENGSVLLSTGASETFNKQNIYDLAGNVFEWTLEYTSNSSRPESERGGHFKGLGNVRMAVNRYDQTTSMAGEGIGFRVALYTDENLGLDRIYNASNLDGNGTTGVATTTLKDLSGNYDATIYGNPTFGNGYISLNEGGSSDPQYIDLGPINDLETLTVNIKCSLSEIGTKMALINNYEAGGFGIEVSAAGKAGFAVYRENGTAYDIIYSTTTLQANAIYDITGVYDGTKLYIYIGGILEATLETAGGNIKNPNGGGIVNVFIAANPSTDPTDRVHSLGTLGKMKVYSASISSDVNRFDSSMVLDAGNYSTWDGTKFTVDSSSVNTVATSQFIKLQTWKYDSMIEQVGKWENLGHHTCNFTKTSSIGYLNFVMNGNAADSGLWIDVSSLTNGKTYTFEFDVTEWGTYTATIENIGIYEQ